MISQNKIFFYIVTQNSRFYNTESDTTMLFEATFDAGATRDFIVRVTTPPTSVEGEEPCILHVSCDFCASSDECDALEETYAKDAFYRQSLTKYATRLQYFCPPGMRFVYDDDDDPGTPDAVTDNEIIECTWNETWTPRDYLPDCECEY